MWQRIRSSNFKASGISGYSRLKESGAERPMKRYGICLEMKFYLAYLLTFYLTYLLTFYVTYLLTFDLFSLVGDVSGWRTSHLFKAAFWKVVLWPFQREMEAFLAYLALLMFKATLAQVCVYVCFWKARQRAWSRRSKKLG